MAIFGKRSQAYETTGLQRPDLAKRVLNQIGMNLLGVDMEGMRLENAMAKQRGAFMDDLAQRVAGSPPSLGEAEIPNAEGQDISAAFSPQFEMRPGRAPLTANSRDLPSLALQAQRLGVPMKDLLEVLKVQQPDVQYDRGFGYNKKTGEGMGAFHPELGEGQMLGPDGVSTLPGYTNSVGEIEAAKAGGQERAKAQLDLITVNLPDGSTQQIPRDVAVQAILQSLTSGQGGAAPAGGFGRSRTPEATIAAEGVARTQAERAAEAPKVRAMMDEMDRTTDAVLARIRDAKAKIGPLTAGLGANLAGIAGTPAYDLAASLKSIGGVVSVDRLQTMRGNSPTGGALGSITERELEMLSSLEGSIAQGQSPQQLLQSLNTLEKNLQAIKTQRNAAYGQTYGEGAPRGTRAPAAPRTSGFRSRIISVQ